MSIKLYNGFRFPTANMVKIRNLLGEFQKDVWNCTVDIICQRYVDLAVRCFDFRCLGKQVEKDEDLSISPMRYAYEQIDSIQKNGESCALADMYNFKFDIAVYPISSRITLGYYFIGDRKLEKLLTSQPWFIDYHYQDQSDPPDDVTSQEWHARRKNWDKVFSFSDVFCNAGFIMSLQDQYIGSLRPYPYMIMPLVPTFSKRLNSLVENAVYEQYNKRKPLDVNRFYSSLQEFRKYQKSHNGKKSAERHEKLIRAKIKRRIGIRDLFGEKWTNPKKNTIRAAFMLEKK